MLQSVRVRKFFQRKVDCKVPRTPSFTARAALVTLILAEFRQTSLTEAVITTKCHWIPQNPSTNMTREKCMKNVEKWLLRHPFSQLSLRDTRGIRVYLA